MRCASSQFSRAHACPPLSAPRYTPQQLYSVIADVDAYASFLPFATKSEVLSAVHDGQTRSIEEQGWLKGGAEGEQWLLEAELKAGAMGFEEGYVSKVEAKKWERVSVSGGFLSRFSSAQQADHPRAPEGHCKGYQHLSTPHHHLGTHARRTSALCPGSATHQSRPLPRLRLHFALPRCCRVVHVGEGQRDDDQWV